MALYLLGLVAFRYRHVHTISRRRLGMALLLLALIPAGHVLPPLAIVGIVAALLAVMIAYETRMYGEGRDRVRHAAGA